MSAQLRTLAATTMTSVVAADAAAADIMVVNAGIFPAIPAAAGVAAANITNAKILDGSAGDWFHLLLSYNNPPAGAADANQREVVRVWQTAGTTFSVVRGVFDAARPQWKQWNGYVVNAALVPTHYDMQAVQGKLLGKFTGGNTEIGADEADNGFDAMRAGLVKGINEVAVGDKRIRTGVLPGANANNANILLLPQVPSAASADARTIATKGDVANVSSARFERGGRSLQEVVGGSNFTGSNYKIVGGDYGDLVHVIEITTEQVILAAGNIEAFSFIRANATNGAAASITGAADYAAGIRWWVKDNIAANTAIAGYGNINRKIGRFLLGAVSVVQHGELYFLTLNNTIADFTNEVQVRAALEDASTTGVDSATVDNPTIFGELAVRNVFAKNLRINDNFWRKGILQPQNNMSATALPAATNDITEGYARGSLWMDTQGTVWICQSAVEDAAEWHVFQLGRGLTGVVLWDGEAVNSGTITLTTGTFATAAMNLTFEGDPGGDAVVAVADFDTDNIDTALISSSTQGASTSNPAQIGTGENAGVKISEAGAPTPGRTKTQTLTITRTGNNTVSLSLGNVGTSGGSGNVPGDPPEPKLTKILAN
ncbi:MAG: hypothetical protein ACR2PR_09295 [Pseudohongiellaceae bacterium]